MIISSWKMNYSKAPFIMGLKVKTNSSNQAKDEEEQLIYFQLTQWKSYYLDSLEVHDVAAVIADFAIDFNCFLVEGLLEDSYYPKSKDWLEVLAFYYWIHPFTYSTKDFTATQVIL
jgi:hypothetical protein